MNYVMYHRPVLQEGNLFNSTGNLVLTTGLKT